MFLSIVSSLFLSGVSAELVLLLAVWRHGDRAPERLPYPNDKNGEEAWPRGWEQLTNLGISQGFELGTFLRKRYAGQLFARDFNRKEVFVQSSDSERAMETGQAVMAGLFPAEGNRVWNASTEWQPTPMHTNGKGREDPLLKPTGVFCPNYEAIRKRDFHRLEMRMDKKYGGLFDWLSAETGMNVSFANVKKLYDVDKEIMHSLPQPDWVYTSWEGEKVLNLIRELKRLSRMEDFNSFKKARFRGGYLLNDWLTRIEEVEVRKKTPKAVLYSSHDGTVASLMHAMGVTDNQLVPFAGCFFVEVVRDEANDLYVQMFYRNATLGDPQILRLKNCSTECPVTDFIRLLEPNRIRSEIELKTICSCASNKGLMFFIYILLVKFASF